MEISSYKTIEDPEVQDMIQDIMEHDTARKKRQEMTESSFKEFLYNALRMMSAKLGYKLQNFAEFWKDVGISIVDGFRDGRTQARHEAELRRKKREMRYD